MQLFRSKTYLAILMAFLSLAACEEDEPNLEQQLIDTYYCGEFEFARTAAGKRFVFSIDFLPDNRVVWSDITGNKSGSWELSGDLIRMEFDDARFEAKYDGSRMTDILGLATQDKTIKYLYQSARPDESKLLQKSYKGQSTAGSYSIRFDKQFVTFSLFEPKYLITDLGGSIICRQENAVPGGVGFFIFPYANTVAYNSTLGTIGSIAKDDLIFYQEAIE
jgi:hypothetical protein